jgi:hypothetical protein
MTHEMQGKIDAITSHETTFPGDSKMKSRWLIETLWLEMSITDGKASLFEDRGRGWMELCLGLDSQPPDKVRLANTVYSVFVRFN